MSYFSLSLTLFKNRSVVSSIYGSWSSLVSKLETCLDEQ